MNKFGKKYATCAKALGGTKIEEETSKLEATYEQSQNKINKKQGETNEEFKLIVQSLNAQVKMLQALLAEIYEATTFHPIEQVRKQKIIEIINNPEIKRMQEQINKYIN